MNICISHVIESVSNPRLVLNTTKLKVASPFVFKSLPGERRMLLDPNQKSKIREHLHSCLPIFRVLEHNHRAPKLLQDLGKYFKFCIPYFFLIQDVG